MRTAITSDWKVNGPVLFLGGRAASDSGEAGRDRRVDECCEQARAGSGARTSVAS